MRVIIVHGYNSNPKRHFYPWLAEELRKLGYEVIVPELPRPIYPDRDTWLFTLHEEVGDVDLETIFITHSLGTLATMQFLLEQPEGTRCRALIAVSPFVIDRFEPLFHGFFKVPVDYRALQERIGEMRVISSREDIYAPFENTELLKHAFNCGVTECPGKKHFNDFEGIRDAPEVLEVLRSIIQP